MGKLMDQIRNSKNKYMIDNLARAQAIESADAGPIVLDRKPTKEELITSVVNMQKSVSAQDARDAVDFLIAYGCIKYTRGSLVDLTDKGDNVQVVIMAYELHMDDPLTILSPLQIYEGTTHEPDYSERQAKDIIAEIRLAEALDIIKKA